MGVWLKRAMKTAKAFVLNLTEVLLLDALKSWGRNRAAVAPAIGSAALVLLLVGVGELGAVVFESVAGDQAREASVLHLYIADKATGAQVDSLHTKLVEDPTVVSVVYVSSADALQRARERPGMAELLNDIDGNPIPAGFDVRVRSLPDVDALVRRVAGDPALDADQPTSYDAASYQGLQQAIRIAALVIIAVVAAVGLIATGVIANAIRAAAVAREDEVRTMGLVGAPRWLVRAPFVFEGAVTGAGGAFIAAGLLLLICYLLGETAGNTTLSVVLPGVTPAVAFLVAAGLVPSGAALGSGSALIATRRLAS
jgi:cell division transport system permease protein